MNILVFGATGMVGLGVLRECLRAVDVERLQTVGRSASGAQPREVPSLSPFLGELLQTRLLQVLGSHRRHELNRCIEAEKPGLREAR